MKLDRVRLVPSPKPETSQPVIAETPVVATTGVKNLEYTEVSGESERVESKNHKILSLAIWSRALTETLPVYVAIHIAFFVTTCLALLLREKDFYGTKFPVSMLWTTWNHWDAGVYRSIALHGYHLSTDSAFFPLFPLVERMVLISHLTTDSIVASLIVSNFSWLIAMIVLYQLVLEDFGQEQAQRTLLYYAIFPTAFFLASGYNESFFLCLTLLSFYLIRHERWWLAGFFGLLACLTRETGIFLVLPFLYEYARQHDFQIKKMINASILAVALIPAGIGLYCLYCYRRWGDPLEFVHAEASWARHLQLPWFGMMQSFMSISEGSILSFQGLRNLTDLVPTLFVLVVLILSIVGPWRLSKERWAYAIYGLIFFVCLQLIASTGFYPLASSGRFMLELFPVFIVIAALGKQRWFHLNYMLISAAILFFLTEQFLAGHWVL